MPIRQTDQFRLWHANRGVMVWLACLAASLIVCLWLYLLVLSNAHGNTQNEYGQTIEGLGRANFDWFKEKGCKFGIAFTADRSGEIVQVAIPWRTTPPGYGSGNSGIYTCRLCASTEKFLPADTVLAEFTDLQPKAMMQGHDDCLLPIPLRATLTAGQLYYLVLSNTDPQPAVNWSSANTVMTRIQPWEEWVRDGQDARAVAYKDGRWSPWCSKSNPWNTTGRNTLNGAHVALLITWADGAVSGDPYWSSAMDDPAYLWGVSRAGEYISWQEQTITIARLGLSVAKIGDPAGPLHYHLEDLDTGSKISGMLANPEQIGKLPTWVYATLPAPFTIVRGRNYRLWFTSPSSTDRKNCYLCHPMYGPGDPQQWAHAGWGGADSYFITDIGNGWIEYRTHDLSFSLQPAAK